MTVADTSLTAYRSLDLQQSEQALMRLVHMHFPFPRSFTRKELSAKTGWEINRIAGRVNGLVAKGYIKEYDQTRDGSHLLSVAPPKTAAPAPFTAGESATPSAASAATDMRGSSPRRSNAPPVAVVPDESLTCDGLYIAVGHGPGWPPDQDEQRRKRRAA